MTKKIAILQSNYIPWKGYFDIIAKSDVFVIYDEVQYTKNDWRNRNQLLTNNGKQWITIPVRQEHINQKIYETKVSANNWQKKHISTLIANYSKAKYFKEYKDEIFEIYNFNSVYLSEINIFFIKSISNILEIKTDIIDSRELILNGDKNNKLIEACKKLKAEVYISGASAQNYLDVNAFLKENISIEWMDYTGYQEYSQVFKPFHHNVSILDLIFNTGPDAKSFLKYI